MDEFLVCLEFIPTQSVVIKKLFRSRRSRDKSDYYAVRYTDNNATKIGESKMKVVIKLVLLLFAINLVAKEVVVSDSFDGMKFGTVFDGRKTTKGDAVWRDRKGRTVSGNGQVLVSSNDQQAYIVRDGLIGTRTISMKLNLNHANLSKPFGGVYLAMMDNANAQLFAIAKRDLISVRLITAGPNALKLQLNIYEHGTGTIVTKLSRAGKINATDDLTLSLTYDPANLSANAKLADIAAGSSLNVSHKLSSKQVESLKFDSYGFGVVGYKAGSVVLDDFLLKSSGAAISAVVALKKLLQDKPLDVYICAGQSNMAGARSEKALLPAELQAVQENVFVFDGNDWRKMEPAEQGFGPEISFAYEMQKQLNKPIGIIKHSKGGTSLAVDWNQKDPKSLYAGLKAKVDAAKKSQPMNIKGMIWMQGERDSRDSTMAGAYKNNLEQLIRTARGDFGNSKMPFIAGRVNPLYPFVDEVRSAQEKCDMPDYGFINCDDLKKYTDNLHYMTPDIVKMGQRFAAMLKQMNQ